MYSRGSRFFVLRRGDFVLVFHVSNVFPSNFQRVPQICNVFPKMFPIVPHFLSDMLCLKFVLFSPK